MPCYDPVQTCFKIRDLLYTYLLCIKQADKCEKKVSSNI